MGTFMWSYFKLRTLDGRRTTDDWRIPMTITLRLKWAKKQELLQTCATEFLNGVFLYYLLIKTIFKDRKSKWVWEGYTTIAHCRPTRTAPRGRATEHSQSQDIRKTTRANNQFSVCSPRQDGCKTRKDTKYCIINQWPKTQQTIGGT